MSRINNATALGISLGVHAVLLVAMAMVKFSLLDQPADLAVETVFSEERRQEEFSQELDINTEISESLAITSGATVSTAIGGSNAPAVAQTKIEASESMKDPEIPINVGAVNIPGANLLGTDLGEGEITGETGAVVQGYGAAMSRLTQEILRLMRQQKVIVVWLFDESYSMTDDRKQIREQFQKVYQELKIAEEQNMVKRRGDETLLTAVLSYGADVHTHTPQPTNDVPKIQAAIDKVPIDETGKENLFQSLSKEFDKYSSLAAKQKRKLAFVVVSDESGDDAGALEEVIQKVKRIKTPVYVMSREAIFGYPYARQRWVDPETGLHFWVDVNRGPETAMPEALQYDGLHRRWDSYSSGFGPYAMVRLAKESGGIFFLIPGDEERLAGRWSERDWQDRRFDQLAMKQYEPLLLSMRDYERSRSASPFRTAIWEVIADMNPHRDETLNIREHWYPFAPEDFRPEGQANAQRALQAFRRLDLAIKKLESVKELRAKEDSMRWRAAYDLIVAQCLAYRVRLFQTMLAFDKHMKQMPPPKDPKSNRWNLRRTKNLLPPDEQQVKFTGVNLEELEKQRQRSIDQFQLVKKEHSGTPWARRAQHELNLGFGMEFVEVWRDPRYDDENLRSKIKVPKF